MKPLTPVWIDGAKFERYLLPGNFWRWTRKAQLHYILKRWPAACCYHNATPPGLSGRKLSWISAAERQRFDRRTTTRGSRTYITTGSRVGKSDFLPLPPTE